MLNSASSVLALANCIADLLPLYLKKWNRYPPVHSNRRNLSRVNDLVAGYIYKPFDRMGVENFVEIYIAAETCQLGCQSCVLLQYLIEGKQKS